MDKRTIMNQEKLCGGAATQQWLKSFFSLVVDSALFICSVASVMIIAVNFTKISQAIKIKPSLKKLGFIFAKSLFNPQADFVSIFVFAPDFEASIEVDLLIDFRITKTFFANLTYFFWQLFATMELADRPVSVSFQDYVFAAMDNCYVIALTTNKTVSTGLVFLQPYIKLSFTWYWMLRSCFYLFFWLCFWLEFSYSQYLLLNQFYFNCKHPMGVSNQKRHNNWQFSIKKTSLNFFHTISFVFF